MTAAVYFTFPDRGFRYECRGCGACCKGHGIGLDVAGGQLVQLAARRPEIVPFLRRRGEAVTAFNPRDRCWFLEDDGLCRVEVEDGRAAKPASCRLFPFNRVFRLGDVVVVDFNSVICPLQLAPAGDGVPHADVLAELATITDPAIVGTPLPGDGAAFLAQEQPIAAALFAADATLDSAWAAQAGAAGLADARADVDALFAATGAGAWAPPADLAAARLLTPSLRFNELYGPRAYAPRAAMGPVLARMWLAWLGFCGLGERLARRPLGLQEMTTVWSEQAPLLHVAARWRDVPVRAPGAIELPSADPAGAVRALAQAAIDNRKARRPLSALVAAMPADPIVRVTALKLADGILRTAFS